jgi:hypothetical protein
MAHLVILVLIGTLIVTGVVSAGNQNDITGLSNLSLDSGTNLSRSVAESLHAFRYNEAGTWSAWNEEHHTGVLTKDNDEILFSNSNGTVGIQLQGIGRGGIIIPPGESSIFANGRLVKIDYADVSEWYINRNDGFEQGMNISARPEGEGLLQVSFLISGDLVPDMAGNDVIFSDQYGPVLRYSGLQVSDSSGAILPGSIVLDENRLSWVIDDTDALYPVVIDPLITEDKIISASDESNYDEFGRSVAISYSTAVIGAPNASSGANEIGKVYILYRNEGGTDNWGEVKVLTASDAAEGDEFGYSVSISGNTVLVGSPQADTGGFSNCGQAYIFYRDSGGADNWGEEKILRAGDKADSDLFGQSVSISGDTALVGAPLADSEGTDRGHVYVFNKDQGGADNWGQIRVRTASDRNDGDFFGSSVAISGDIALVGAPFAESGGTERGQAYVLYRDQGGADNWGQKDILTAPGKYDYNYFGGSVAVSGNVAVIGEDNATSGGVSRCGRAHIFYKDNGGADTWGLEKTISASDKVSYSFFGRSVGISGNKIVVGAFMARSGDIDHGQAYVFRKDQGGLDNWGEERILSASDKADYAWFSSSVSVSEFYNFESGWNSLVLAGAPFADSGGTNRGQAYIFNVRSKSKIAVFRSGFWILDKNGNIQWDGEPADKVAGFGMAGDIPVIGNWDHTVREDKIGVFRNGLWLLDYNGNYQWDIPDKMAALGTTGDIPVIGDWNNDKDDEIGVFRNGFWILDKSGNFVWEGEPADEVAGFGMAGDIPVVGDWNNDKDDEIGVFRNGFWILDKSGNFAWDGEPADEVAGFGMAGDVPVVRDWNGDGLPEIGVFRPSTGQWIIDDNRNFQWDGTGAGQDIDASLGTSGDTPVGGTWAGATSDNMGVFRSGFWILDFNGNYQWDGGFGDKVVGFGTTGDIPVTGKFS